MWIALLITTGIAAALVVRRAQRHAHREPPPAWRLAADQLGGTLVTDPLRLSATIDETEATVSVDEGAAWTIFTVRATALPEGVRFSGPTKGEKRGETELQDPSFDGNVAAAGDELLLMALCDTRTRRRLERLGWSSSFVIADGRMTARMAGLASAPMIIVQIVREMVGIARSFDLEQRGLPDRLAGIVKADHVAAVRRRAFNLLHQFHGDTVQMNEARAAALGDADPGLRLMAAETLEPEAARGHLTLLVGDATVAAEVRTHALEVLLDGHPREAIVAALDEALAGPPDAFAGPALAACATLEHPPRPEALAAWAGGIDEAAAPALICALEAAGGAEGEAGLLTLLARDDLATRRAAAVALTTVAGPASIDALRTLASDRHEDAELRSACSRAAEAATLRQGTD